MARRREATVARLIWPQKHLRLLLMMTLCMSLLAFGRVSANAATSAAPLDYQVQAAMLYKFLAYIDWPQARFDDADSAYRIAVVGDDDIEEELRHITAGRTVNNRPIEVSSVSRLSRIGSPHLVFVGRSAEEHLPRLARLARRKSFLVVTESDALPKVGSAINLRLIDGRIGFDVSLPHAHEANIRLSARLLSVASSVERADH